MSGRIILNSEILNDLIDTNSLVFQEKFQRTSGKNYYISPTIGIKIFNAKVSWIDSYKKNISFIFSKHENLSLLHFLKSIQQKLIHLYKTRCYNPQNVSSIYYEKGDYFYVKVYLPNMNNKYNIISSFNGEQEPFKIPRVGITYDSIILDIRNIWEKDTAAGFNLELKETYVTI